MSPASSIGGQTLDASVKNKMPALGIDLGGTKLSAAVVVDYRIVSEPKTMPTPHGPKNIVDAIIELIRYFQKDYVLAGAGIATAGIVNVETGDIIGSTGNLPGWTGTPLKRIIEERTILPVHVENDANAAAYGDTTAMQLQDKACVVGVTLGTGIGTGIIIDGKVFRGAHLAAAEGGHIKINLGNQRLCTCGLFDCWEAYGAGRGLVATAQDLLPGLTHAQTELVAQGNDLTTRMITQAAQNGDLIAKKALKQWHEHLAVGLSVMAHLLDPDCFIISGGMSNAVDYALLTELTVDRCMPRHAEGISVRQSALGNNAGIIGAAHIVLDSISL